MSIPGFLIAKLCFDYNQYDKENSHGPVFQRVLVCAPASLSVALGSS